MNNMEFLKKKFEELKDNGCQIIPRNSTGDIGNYFEKWLGLSNNYFSVPDFGDIEIKVKSCNSIYPINLFSLTCDGPDFFEMRRFINKFGVIDKDFPEAKILFLKLSGKSYINWGKYLKMKLIIDKKREKIFIIVSNINGKIIEKRAYWDFSSVKNVLERKLSILCYVKANVIYSHKSKFVWYDKMFFYKLKGFDSFLEMLSEGKINIIIKYGVYKSGKRRGLTYDHGTSFVLEQESIDDLFYLVESV